MVERPALWLAVRAVFHRDLVGVPVRQHVPGLGHPRRGEHVLREEPLIAHAGHLLDDRREDAVSGVGVGVRICLTSSSLVLPRPISGWAHWMELRSPRDQAA